MKNPWDSLKFWKRPDSGASEPAVSMGFPTAEQSYPTYATSILKDFIVSITRKPSPVVLDIGPVVGSNIEFFFELGIKIYMEDFLAAYSNPVYTKMVDEKLTWDDEKFFRENFDYADQFFDGLICWDLLSYLEPKFAKTFVERIAAKMKPDSLVLGFFYTQRPQAQIPVRKYKISSDSALEHIPQQLKMEVRKAYQTRDVTQLFSGYQSQKFYLLKHNMLEVMLKKRVPSELH
jgi:hypothetical protein